MRPTRKSAGSRNRTPPAERSTKATPKGEETYSAILEAAVDVIGQQGYRATNLTSVAKRASVTRGCIQYYFVTGRDLVEVLTRYVEYKHWQTYVDGMRSRPLDRDRIEFAIDLIGNPLVERYQIARLELMLAARTEPSLRRIMVKAVNEIERLKCAFTEELFGEKGIADSPPFRAARDLTAIVDDWMLVHVFPERAEERKAGVREALRMALHVLWRDSQVV